MRNLFAVVLLVVAPLAWGHAGHEDMAAMPKDFDNMKQLLGTWEGTAKMGDKNVAISSTYELTSGGSVIMEKMANAADHSHDMLNVYHRDGKTLAMTHYCAMGNEPMMVLKKADAKSMVWEMDKPVGVANMNEPHMHGLTVTMIDKDTIKQEWFNYVDGKKADSVVFNLKRKTN